MDGWELIYSGHEHQVERDRQDLAAAGIESRVGPSPTEVLPTPYAEGGVAAWELRVAPEYAVRALVVLDLTGEDDYELEDELDGGVSPGARRGLRVVHWAFTIGSGLVAIASHSRPLIAVFVLSLFLALLSWTREWGEA